MYEENERAAFALLASTKPGLTVAHCSCTDKRQLHLSWPTAVSRPTGKWGVRGRVRACAGLCVKLRERKREGKEVGAGRYHNVPLNPLRIWRVGQTWPARPNEMARGGVRGGSTQNNPFSVLCWACFLRAQLDNSHRSHVCAGRKGKSSKKHTGSLSHTNTQEKKKKRKTPQRCSPVLNHKLC